MNIYVDIDDTICINESDSLNYELAKPIQERIDTINRIFDAGHTIVYWTARGTKTGIDWSDVTKQQLNEWGARYTDLRFGKPAYDLFICDKAMSDKSFFNQVSALESPGERDE